MGLTGAGSPIYDFSFIGSWAVPGKGQTYLYPLQHPDHDISELEN